MTHDSSGIKNEEGGRHFRHRHLRLHYETNFLKRQLRYSSGHVGSFNPSVITNAEAYMIYGNVDSPKRQRKIATLVVKRTPMIILEVNLRKKVSCVFQIFLDVFHSCPVPD